MKKKIIIIISIVLILVAGGGFFWWNGNQKDVRELNKNLPEGMRVVKNLFGFGNEYKVVDKIDGYEFKVPKEWRGMKKITYYEQTKTEAPGISIDTQSGDLFGIGVVKLENEQISLESWTQERIIKSIPSHWKIEKQFLNDIETIKLWSEKQSLSGIPLYFFKKDSKIYNISGTSEDFIRYIIANGKW